MFVIQNLGKFSVIIRDLNLNISGGKSVDIDTLVKRENAEKSVDLQRLISSNKLSVLNKDNIILVEQPVVVAKKAEDNSNTLDNTLLRQLRNDILEVKDFLRAMPKGNTIVKSEEVYDEATTNSLVALKVRNLSNNNMDLKTNFDKLGESTNKEDRLDDLLNTLDSLGNDDN